jgi:hypothetical protein
MLEFWIAFTVPLAAFLLAAYKFFEDHMLGACIATVGALAAEAGLLVVGMDFERFRVECTIQSMIHNVALPCDTFPGAYEIIIPVLVIAVVLNAVVMLAGIALTFLRLANHLKQHPKPRSTSL